MTLPGWMTSTENVRTVEGLPDNARKYIEFIEEKLAVPGNYLKPLQNSSNNIFFNGFNSAMDWSGQGSLLNDSSILIVIGYRKSGFKFLTERQT
jgi:hypothetical protein